MTMLKRLGFLVLGGTVLALAGCARHSAAVEAVAGEVGEFAAQAGQPPATGERFAFPADKGGQALGQLLQPPARLNPLSDVPPGPRTLPPPTGVDRPGVPLPPTQAGIASPPGPKAVIIRPHMMPEAAPLSAYRDHPVAPALRVLETGARVVVYGRDVNEPAPLGFLGLPVFDRVPLDDPTVDASVQAALAEPAPPRTLPVPFTPLNLPDPFVNAQTVKLQVAPPEGPLPVTVPIRTPPPETPPAKP